MTEVRKERGKESKVAVPKRENLLEVKRRREREERD